MSPVRRPLLAAALALLAGAACGAPVRGAAPPHARAVEQAAPRCSERELVVLVHGMGRTPLSMLPMAVALRRQGYEVLNFGYSSYGPSVAEIGSKLAAEVREEGPPRRVHFVGHSLGNIIVRWMLEYERPDHLGRVVMLAPPNQGSRLADRLERPLGWLLEPLSELTTDSLSTARRLPPPEGVEFAVLAGDRDGKVSVAETFLPGAREHRVVPSRHTFIMLRPSVVEMTGRFLRTGSLEEPEDPARSPAPTPIRCRDR
jgi:alpha-beta hydrolase superfamily lysophospholipase